MTWAYGRFIFTLSGVPDRGILLQNNLLEICGNYGFSIPDDLILFSAIFIVGTCAAFLTPLACLIQLLGLGLFLIAMPQMGHGWHLGIGGFLGIASTALVLVSQLIYIGIYPRQKKREHVRGLLTVSGKSTRIRVNLLSLIGALIGAVSVQSAWATVTSSYSSIYSQPFTESFPATPIIYLANLGDSWGNLGIGKPVFYAAMLLFIIGCTLATVTPFGTFAQLLGVGLFYTNITGYLVSTNESYLGLTTYSTASLSIGFYLALLAGCVTLASLVFPIGIGYEGMRMPLIDRLLIWHVSEDKRQQAGG